MKNFKGVAHNINMSLLGKITRKHNIFSNKENLIFVAENQELPSGYLAVITSSKLPLVKPKSIIVQIENTSELNENDIVLIEPNGSVNVVYDSLSIHNAIFITGKCNSNCIMCPQPPVKEEADMFDLNLKYISLLDKNIKSIGITGGEPTLIGDKLNIILNAIYQKAPKASINMLSNGIKFDDFDFTHKFANSIKQDLIVDIPIFSDIDTIHNSIVRTNSFYKTINGIYNLAKFNVKIGIRIVIHKMNYDRLFELSEFIYRNFPFVYHVVFIQMEPIGYAKDNLDNLWIDPLDYNIELEKAVLNLYFKDLYVSIYNTQLCVIPERLRKFAVQSISDWKDIYVSECDECILRLNCGGLFSSSRNIHSRGIKPILPI